MLPSGNDAAYTLAEHFGTLLFKEKYASDAEKERSCYSYKFNGSFVKYFLKEMNINAERLKMHATSYDSPHGLMNVHNYSTAADQAKLTCEIMKYDRVRQVVCTQKHECKADFSKKENKTAYKWENTNFLLGQPGFIGTKTGITKAAGPCLSASYEKDGVSLVIIVLSSRSME